MSSESLVLMKISMGRNPAVDVVVPFTLLPEACKFFIDKGEAISLIGDGKDPNNAIFVADYEDKPSYISLLLVRGDPGRALPGFVNPSSRAVKPIVADEPGFVPGASCHVVISKQAVASGHDQGRHRLAMESTRGVSRSLARRFLADLLFRFAKAHPDRFIAEKKRRSKREKPRQVSYVPTVRFFAQPNASLEKDLQDGKIGGFKLSHGKTSFSSEANEPHIQNMDIKLDAKIVPTKDAGAVRKLVTRVKSSVGSVDFDAVTLELVDDEGNPAGYTKAFPLDSFDDSDLRYSRKLPIPFEIKTSETYEKFCNPIKEFAIKALKTDANWT